MISPHVEVDDSSPVPDMESHVSVHQHKFPVRSHTEELSELLNWKTARKRGTGE